MLWGIIANGLSGMVFSVSLGPFSSSFNPGSDGQVMSGDVAGDVKVCLAVWRLSTPCISLRTSLHLFTCIRTYLHQEVLLLCWLRLWKPVPLLTMVLQGSTDCLRSPWRNDLCAAEQIGFQATVGIKWSCCMLPVLNEQRSRNHIYIYIYIYQIISICSIDFTDCTPPYTTSTQDHPRISRITLYISRSNTIACIFCVQ